MVRFSLAGSIRFLSPALLIGSLAVGGCAGSDMTSSTEAGSIVSPSVTSDLDDDSVDSTTAPTPVSTTDVAAVSTSPKEDSTTISSEVPAEPVLPHGEGSGCVVQGDTLPDGRWFGYVAAADEAGLSFDLACWFIGEEANMVAAQDGEESPVPNDYYVRNKNARLRNVPVGDSTVVFWLLTPGSPDEAAVDYSFWLANASDRPYQPGAWIVVESGVVSTLTEQYTP